MYSDMSMRTMASSESNRNDASACSCTLGCRASQRALCVSEMGSGASSAKEKNKRERGKRKARRLRRGSGVDLAQLCLANAGGAHEQEAGQRLVGVRQPRAAALHRLGDGRHGGALPQHTRAQNLLELEQLVTLRLHELRHRNARPAADHLADVRLGDFIRHAEAAAAARGGGRLLSHFELVLQADELPVLEFGRLGQVVLALGLRDGHVGLVNLLFDLRHARHRAARLLPLGAHHRLLRLHGNHVGVQPRQARLGCRPGLVAQRESLHFHLYQPPVEVVERARLAGELHLELGRRLVHHVDGLVGQESLRDVPVGQRGRLNQRRVGDAHAVVHLVALAQASQDGNGRLHRRLVHQHRLEAALQRRILLDVFAVLLERRGADAAQLAAAEHGLEQVARVKRPFRGARAHHGVDLVDEEHDAPRSALHLLQHAL
mmetsp:Transcript_13089/g.40862  ORF Transcript_13089/g.40862 Transcript_13089/m.40862 type:complete len:433 (-) Transcript_13089:866-2164(-)